MCVRILSVKCGVRWCVQAVFEIGYFRRNPAPFFMLAKVQCAEHGSRNLAGLRTRAVRSNAASRTQNPAEAYPAWMHLFIALTFTFRPGMRCLPLGRSSWLLGYHLRLRVCALLLVVSRRLCDEMATGMIANIALLLGLPVSTRPCASECAGTISRQLPPDADALFHAAAAREGPAAAVFQPEHRQPGEPGRTGRGERIVAAHGNFDSASYLCDKPPRQQRMVYLAAKGWQRALVHSRIPMPFCVVAARTHGCLEHWA